MKSILLFLLLICTSVYGQKPIKLPRIERDTCNFCAPKGWEINEKTPDVIRGNGRWPGPCNHCDIIGVDGDSTNGNMAIFICGYTTSGESWKTTLKGLNTLAQNVTTSAEHFSGTGCNVSTSELRERKGKTKFIGCKIALALVYVAKEELDFEFVQKAYNTFHCLSEVKYKNGVMFGKYCKNRFCPTCLGIRKADLINKYRPFLCQWNAPYFLTLTTKSCSSDELESLIELQKSAFSRIINRNKVKVSRGKAQRLNCLRCHECNFNPIKKTYNPHFHLIVPDWKTANYLAYEWQNTINEMVGYEIANNVAQEYYKIKDLEYNLIETIKYGTKIFTEKDATSQFANDSKLYAKAFYHILKAFEGKRLLSTYGFTLPDEVKNETKVLTQLHNPSRLIYLIKEHDWVNPETGSMLTQYTPNQNLRHILSNIDLRIG